MKGHATADASGMSASGSGEAGLCLPRTIEDPVILRISEGGAGEPWSARSHELAVFVESGQPHTEGRLAVAGRHERDGHLVRFIPTYRFVAGQDYVVRTRRVGEPPQFAAFNITPRTAPSPAVVTQVYPSGDALPENVLRFYVHFSVPMAPHRAWEFVRLRDASGAADDAAFMKFKQELWNEDRTRLTVLVDPGRIKRSVATNLSLGPALLEGNRYALTIDAGWPAADGASVLPGWSRTFMVTSPLRSRPDAGGWQWRLPKRGTRDPLEATFDRSFDRHLLPGALRVVTSDGRVIPGTSQLGDSEASWSFTPEQPWPSCVRVTIDERLEDVAGNSVRGVLDRDLSAAASECSPPEPVLDLSHELRSD